MTMLKSSEILSTVTPKPESLALENVVAGPITPAKTSELLNQSSNSDTPRSSFPAHCGSRGCSIMVSEGGTVRRLSARLAEKVGRSDYLENVEVVRVKRKKVEGTSMNGEFDVRNLGSQVSDLEFGGDSSGGVTEPIVVREILQDSDDGGVTELVKEDGEGINDSGSVAKSRFGYYTESIMVETVNNGRRKRRFSMEVKALGSQSPEGQVEKGFLSLRSGKRVVKRGMEDDFGCDGNLLEITKSSKESGVVLSGGEKGKGKVDSETSVLNDFAPVKRELDDSVGLSAFDSNQEVVKDISIVKFKSSIVIEDGVRTRGRLSVEEKGKMKASASGVTNTGEPKVENVTGSSFSDADHSAANEALQDEIQVRNTDATVHDTRSVHRERFRKIARRNASRFAHFSFQDEFGTQAHDIVGREIPVPESSTQLEDWPGPFSTAMKIIKDRERNRDSELCGASTDKSEAIEVKWIPQKQELCKQQKQVPSLQELCFSVLSDNADAIASLDFVPDALRHKICWFLCGRRRMDSHFLELLVHGTPTEIRVRDCSWLSEELLTKTFEGCNASKLTVLQLDQCGVCMPDYTLYAALAHSPNSLPALTMLSLKGAYRLSDAGLSMLVLAAPALKSVDISQCPLLTAEGICSLASSLRLVLRELYLDNCHGIDAMLILPALQKLEKLEVLSVAGIQTVCDDFVSEFISSRGCGMKELVLADCMELTDSSLKVIGDTCFDLQAIDLSNLCKLTDTSIGHLANGCRAIQTLKLCRNTFRDEAIAAYLDVRGACLKDLSLNNIIQVSNHTALSLVRNCRNIRNLDLSWCRNLTNEALGLIVDSCSLLEVLKLFGCTQVTNVFLNGHLNRQVKLIGLKMAPVIEHIDVPDFLRGPLRYSSTCP